MYFEIPGTKVRVMGSMHLLPAGGSGLPSWAQRAYEWSEVLVFESDPAVIFKVLRASPDVRLGERLSKDAWNALNRIWPLDPSVIPSLESIQPWAVFLFANALTLNSVEGIEPNFLQWAAQSSKEVHFLETGEQLADALDSAPLDEVLESIELLARDLSAPQISLESMYQAWTAKDLPGLYEVASSSPSFKLPGVRRAAIQTRNEAWTPGLRELLRSSKRTLVAVGALHLYGPGNLFSCLGYEAHALTEGG